MEKNKKIQHLTQAFEDFTSIIYKFEQNHNVLQDKIEYLSKELHHKNEELERQIQEKDEMQIFLQSILESIYSGVIVVDQHGKINIFNKAAETITGYRKKEALSKNYKQIFKKVTSGFDKSALYTLSTGKESHHREKKIITADEEEKSVEFSTSIIRDLKGKTTGVAEIINDISELRKLQDRITHIETLAALGEMAASVAHEIRNPLGGIGGFAGLLERQISKDDPRKRLVKPIIEGVARLNNIVSNLLTYTRPHQLKPTEVSLHKALNEILHFFRVSISNEPKKVEIVQNYYKNDIMLMLDSQLFQQVIMNLVKNAYEAMNEKGKLTITTRIRIPSEMNEIIEEEEKSELLKFFSMAEIEIEDTGEGIPTEILNKLFNPFFTTKDNGNGLGLAICQKIIQLHRGEIHVESEAGVGTKFILILPLYENYE